MKFATARWLRNLKLWLTTRKGPSPPVATAGVNWLSGLVLTRRAGLRIAPSGVTPRARMSKELDRLLRASCQATR